ncbi:rhomboid family intramembrane serine protease [Ilyomonas limi]|uniref:Rhomboid family intramembrane serine protease n=1 Tax=Ilyomonas limi TaxID=2575867 RepID=A0A4U3L9Q2_9BACT|nr:rhomboid family intramembrane serine protease [Ilyomonas limi]TKK72038.1 rhomboid family intramembrane serine protease [Ilyomonas limi]
MTNTGIVGILLIIANVAFSYKGFTSSLFFYKYNFEVEKILVYKDYKRLVTSGFLHVNWMHLIFNMLALYFFSGPVENYLGPVQFLIIYFASLVGGDLLSLFIHKNQSFYSSVGASGAICGIIFASIALFPGMSIGLFPLSISIPGWLFGIAYVLYSVYGIKSRIGNSGHDAHLGGALIGMLVALLFHPAAFAQNYFTILLIAIPTIIFLYLIITRPHVLLIDNAFSRARKNHYSIDHKVNEEKINSQKEIDRILDKINKHGMSSLSRQEKEKLKRYSQSVK